MHVVWEVLTLFRVTLSVCVFLNVVLTVQPNTTYISSTMVFYSTMLRFSAVQISHHKVDVGHTKRNIKAETPLFAVQKIITILFQKKK
jgi:hypothetical protein